MKKIILLLTLLIICPFTVWAEEEKLVVNTNELLVGSANNNNFQYQVSTGNNLKLKDGSYIKQRVLDDENSIKRITFAGETLWEFKLSESLQTDPYVYQLDDDYLFVLESLNVLKININDGQKVNENTEIKGFKIIKKDNNFLAVNYDSIIEFNEKLEINNSISFDSFVKQKIDKKESTENDNKWYYLADVYLQNKDNKIYLLVGSITSEKVEETTTNYYDYYIMEINKSLDELSLIASFSESNRSNLYAIDSDFLKVDNNFYFLTENPSGSLVTSIDSEGNVNFFQNDFYNNEKISNYYTSMIYNGKYFFLAGTGIAQEQQTKATIIERKTPLVDIYDKNWNLIETIYLESDATLEENQSRIISVNFLSGSIDLIDGGFIVNSAIPDLTTPYANSRALYFQPYNELFSEYKFIYDIATKTDEFGTIEVIDEAFSGDMIAFNVKAKTGYKLKSLSITNSDFETVTFTEDELVLNYDGTFSLSRNSFKMPSSDVEISAAFELIVENPKTLDNIESHVSMLIIDLVLIVGSILYKKKYTLT